MDNKIMENDAKYLLENKRMENKQWKTNKHNTYLQVKW